MNWSYVLERHAEEYPDKEAVVFENKRITYKELNRRVNALSQGLLEIGLAKRDLLAILSYNCLEFIELSFAVNKIGAIWVPVNWRLTEEELAYIFNDSCVKVIVSSIEFCEVVDSIRNRLPNVLKYINLGSETKKGWHSFSDMLTRNLGCNTATAVVELEDLHKLMYTSGTTAHPKGVMITYGNLYWKCLSHVLEFNFTSDDVCLVAIPLFHSAGMDLPASTIIYQGGTVVPIRKFSPLEILKTIEREKISCLCLVPSAINMLLGEPTLGNYDLSSLKIVIDGGEKMPEPLIERALKGFPNLGWFCNGYGLTESVTGDTFLSREKALEKIGSVGKPVRQLRVQIVGEDDREVPRGSLGEIVLRGPKIFKGYWNKPKETAETLKDGWFHTGDIGYLDEEGYLYIVDRKKDMIKSGGENISSAEVEAIIYELPQVFEVAVVGIPHPKWQEVPKAFVVLKQTENLTAEQIIEYCQKRLAKFKVPKDVEFVPELPKNPQGKILKRELRKVNISDKHAEDKR